MKKERYTRRDFLKAVAVSGGVVAGHRITNSKSSPFEDSLQKKTANAIDRFALVTRHNPVLRQFDVASPLSVGNGEFAFTADITGLQTFPAMYEQGMPLCTMSQWGWHTEPMLDGLNEKDFRLTQYDTHGRSVGYAISSDGQKGLYNWLRENPHRLHLGRIGFRLKTEDNKEASEKDIAGIEQTLDLWQGTITSRFTFKGKPVIVKTSVHPRLDQLAVSVESSLINEGRLAVRIAFPYGSPSMQAVEWNDHARHRSEIISKASNGATINRKLDSGEYFVALEWAGHASLTAETKNAFVLTPANGSSRMEFVAMWSPSPRRLNLPDATTSMTDSAQHWKEFWSGGAAIELADSKDKHAVELERRIVLSQYLTAIQCSGSQPPQETGLTTNSWYGKFHLEMHWWHSAHFALWNRIKLLENSLDWYTRVLPAAKEKARFQGYSGARWPKMVGPDGRDSPSPIGPLLIWQQPHPIFYAELCYRNHSDRQTLDRYREIVFETAEFMASFAFFDEKANRYVLGPPVIPAQENHPPRETWNPTFELAYWSYGLKTAQSWRERLGMKRNLKLDDVILKLSVLPVKDGVYLAHENCPQTFTERNHDHPSMLAALGVLTGESADRETMRRTLHKVLKEWQWDKTWGWDYPMVAMTAARLNEPNAAIDALLMDTEKNHYLPSGHNWQRKDLPCYLPGNGGLLYATAMMANGWKGSPDVRAPGFPSDGSWTVHSEGFKPSVFATI